MTRFLALRRDERGAAAIEMAIAVPVLAVFLWGIFQVGVAMQANAGMQHALGEGARFATICVDPDPDTGCSSPSNDEIKERIEEQVFGTGIGDFDVADPVDAADYKELSVTFSMPTDFLLFKGPDIDITRTKRVYVAS